jgi:primosomal protein N' (replication factor Y)
MLDHCPNCDSQELKGIGVGTQRVETELQSLFPEARIARLDTDTARGSKMYTLLTELSQGNIDILIGTQMVTKGHDFQNITLVGVVAADIALHLPDFRAAERTYQMLTQVAGRTGRGKRGGKVIIQTWSPQHHCIISASQHDFLQFYEKEIKFRRSFRFPPFRRMASLIITGKDQGQVIRAAQNLGNTMNNHPAEIEILGPAPAPLYRLKEKYRWQLIVKSITSSLLGDFIREQMARYRAHHSHPGIEFQIDIDPLFVL